MKLTEFGKVIRKARLDAEDSSLKSMAKELDVSSSYLSGLETGRKKLTTEWVDKIDNYFKRKGVVINKIHEIADVSNKSISLEGLDPMHQAVMAGFARVTDQDTILKLKELLEAANQD